MVKKGMGGFGVEEQLQEDFKNVCREMGEHPAQILNDFMKDYVDTYGFDLSIRRTESILKSCNTRLQDLREKKELFYAKKLDLLATAISEDVFRWNPESGHYSVPSEQNLVARLKFLMTSTKLPVDDLVRAYEKELGRALREYPDQVESIMENMRAAKLVCKKAEVKSRKPGKSTGSKG